MTEIKDLGILNWHDAMKAVEDDPVWRLPTIDELEWMFEHRVEIGADFEKTYYWSATCTNDYVAWYLITVGKGFPGSSFKFNTGRAFAIKRKCGPLNMDALLNTGGLKMVLTKMRHFRKFKIMEDDAMCK